MKCQSDVFYRIKYRIHIPIVSSKLLKNLNSCNDTPASVERQGSYSAFYLTGIHEGRFKSFISKDDIFNQIDVGDSRTQLKTI